MATIKAIEGRSVHQIQSGQVISDGLTSAVKELVENSLDAHATSIDIRFKNYGLDLLEVADNGDGISSENFESLALKHYTSKLSTYDDLESVTTYGFRGEALSSLCALSILSVITATPGVAPKGAKLEFEVSGKLKSTSVTAASKGTTVSVENLFKTLPVRRRELERNIKRDYAKVLNFLQAYAVVCTNVKFTVSNQAVNGKKVIAFATKANKTTKENISNVFGAKTTLALVPLELEFELSSSGPSLRHNQDKDEKKVRITGHISRPVVGEGRQAPDRQMFYVNSRPCTLPQVSRAFNEIYKSFNVTQSPFIFADMRMDTNSYDVNVSPDKRTILLHDQTALVEALKVALTDLFEKQDQTVPSATNIKQTAFKQTTLGRSSSSMVNMEDPVDAQAEVDSDDEVPITSNLPTPPSRVPPQKAGPDTLSEPSNELFAEFSERAAKDVQGGSRIPKDTRIGLTFQQKSKIAHVLSKRHVDPVDSQEVVEHSGGSESDDETPRPKLRTPKKGQNLLLPSSAGKSPSARIRMSPMSKPQPSSTTITIGSTTIVRTPGKVRKPSLFDESSQASPPKGSPLKITKTKISGALLRSLMAPGTQVDKTDDDMEDFNDDEDATEDQHATSCQHKHQNHDSSTRVSFPQDPSDEPLEEPTVDSDDEIQQENSEKDDDSIDQSEQRDKERQTVDRLIRRAEEEVARPTAKTLDRASAAFKGENRDSTTHLVRNVSASIDFIQQDFNRKRPKKPYNADTYQPAQSTLSRAESIDENTTAAEERLSLTIFKADFAKMRIVGQFNLGFILATKISGATKDLFIIDQHASDEKYNFERLQAETIVQNQPLVRAKALELTAMEELIVMDNLETFKKNGFVIEVDDLEETGRRCKLVSLPMSKGVIFDVKDLEELIHLVHQNPNDTSVRPSKVRSMFAMRACRSSIMIGKTLSHKTMGQVVSHMGELDKPWNCPHGRPTLRHVRDLGNLELWSKDEVRIEWNITGWCELVQQHTNAEEKSLEEEEIDEQEDKAQDSADGDEDEQT